MEWQYKFKMDLWVRVLTLTDNKHGVDVLPQHTLLGGPLVSLARQALFLALFHSGAFSLVLK